MHKIEDRERGERNYHPEATGKAIARSCDLALINQRSNMMKKILCGLCALLWLTAAQANCTYYTYTVTVNGVLKTYYCTQCCYGTGMARTCNTTCN
jgi:hypothetical protein